MATATIPELIEPGTLFTPNDALFSVAAADLANGDDALNMLGAAGNYQAYQDALPGVHYPAAPADPFTVQFWYRAPAANSGASATLQPAWMVMGVTDVTAPASATTGGASTTGFSWAVTWSQFSSATEMRALCYHRAKGASSRATCFTNSFPNNAWTLVTIRDAGGGVAPTIWFNNVATTFTGAAGTTATPGALSSPKFHLGWWSTNGAWGTPDIGVRIAKVALFDRLLTDVEIVQQYQSMTLG